MKSMFKGALGALMVVLALSGLTAASALAAGAPIVETKAASSITGTEATLNGHLNPNGAGTKFHFEYGTTISYGSKTLESGESTTEKTVFRRAEGLATNTTYHFRLVATNTYGTSYGKDETFATPPEKPEVVVSEGKVSELEFTALGGEAEVAWGSEAMICTSSEFKGHFINSKELEGKMTWYECFGGDRYECANEKEIYGGGYVHSRVQSEELKGKLGYINSAKKEVGLVLAGKSSEIWAKKLDCLGDTESLNGSLGGQMSPINTKILTSKSLSIRYTEEKDKQITGELGGQLLYPESSDPFGFGNSLTAKPNKAFEIQA